MWLNVFNPRLKQVLSCFMEGCVHRDPLTLDYLLKYSMSGGEVLELMDRMNVEYLSLDKGWYVGTDNVVKTLVKGGYLKPVSGLNNFLRDAIVFKRNVSAVSPSTSPANHQPYLSLSRILGILLTLCATYLLARQVSKIKAHPTKH
jgi:hypothetical protein